MLDPQSIAKKEFKTVRFAEGYDPGEVDDFLDAVHVSYLEVLEKFDRAVEENARLRGLADRTQAVPESPGAGATRLLTIAQTTADGVVAEAQREADEIRVAAQRQVDDERHKAIGQLEETRAKLQSQVQALLDAKHAVITQIKEAMEKMGESA